MLPDGKKDTKQLRRLLTVLMLVITVIGLGLFVAHIPQKAEAVGLKVKVIYNSAVLQTLTCDGENDQNEINTSIALADQYDGAIVQLENGEYHLDGAYPGGNIYFINNDHITVQGCGDSTVILSRNNNQSEVIRPENCYDITVRDLSVAFLPSVRAVNGLTIASSAGQKVEKFTYDNITVTGARTGVCPQTEGESEDVTFNNIRMIDSIQHGYWAHAELPYNFKNYRVTNCLIDGVQENGGIKGFGAYVNCADGLWWENNRIINCPNDGFRAQGKSISAPLLNIHLIGGFYGNNGGSGVNLNAYVNGFEAAGFETAYNAISGIVGQSYVTGGKIENVRAHNNPIGIYVYSISVAIIDIIGNEAYENEDGFQLSGLSRSAISYNKSHNNTRCGMYFVAGTYNVSNLNQLWENTYGMQFNSVLHHTSIGDMVTLTDYDGISTFNQCDYLTFIAPDISGSNQLNISRANIQLAETANVFIDKHTTTEAGAYLPLYNIKIMPTCNDVRIGDGFYGRTGSLVNVLDMREQATKTSESNNTVAYKVEE